MAGAKTEETVKLTRDEMRAKIFGAAPKSEPVEDFFGTDIELRQPTLQVALSQRGASEEDRLYFMLTDYAFVPGTQQKLFDIEDVEQIKQLPFGPEFTRLMDAVNKLLGVKPEEMEKAIGEAEKSA